MRRKVIAYGQYYKDFLATLTEKEIQKVKYVLSLLGTEDRLPIKFIKVIRDGLYELRISYNGNIYRIFFIFDEGQIVVLFNGFHKKTQKTPSSEIDKALKIKEEYYEYKKQHAEHLGLRNVKSSMKRHTLFILVKYCWMHDGKQK